MSRDRTESQKGVQFAGGKCIVCGWNKKNQKGEPLVEGAHIRSFSNVPDYDKYDNIVSMCPNHHTEYDAGNFTIDSVNRLFIFKDSSDPFHLKSIIGEIKHVKNGYFDYHKKHVFDS